jgi:preprotein translocase subunit YajC
MLECHRANCAVTEYRIITLMSIITQEDASRKSHSFAPAEITETSAVMQEGLNTTPPPPQSGGMTGTLIMLGILFGFMYLAVIRPERKRQKERAKFQAELAKGDRVVTAGGIHGTIAALDEHTITIKVSDNVRIKFDRVAVSRQASSAQSE